MSHPMIQNISKPNLLKRIAQAKDIVDALKVEFKKFKNGIGELRVARYSATSRPPLAPTRFETVDGVTNGQ